MGSSRVITPLPRVARPRSPSSSCRSSHVARSCVICASRTTASFTLVEMMALARRGQIACASTRLLRYSIGLKNASQPAVRTALVPHHQQRKLSGNANPGGMEAEPSPAFIEGLKQLDAGKLSKAIEIFAETAAVGDADGNFYLGLAYDGLLGRDAADEPPIELDPEAAVRCYRRAAESGHAQAMLNLSMSYRSGEGVDAPDIEAAFEWLERSAAAGDERAAFNCGVALDPLHPPYGNPGSIVVPKDAARAVQYYRSASDQGHGKAMVNLGCAPTCRAEEP